MSTRDFNAEERQRWGGPSPHAGKGQRRLTPQERIEARHLLQQLTEQAGAARNAMDSQHGVLTVTVGAWAAQWEALKRELDSFTHRAIEDKPAAGGVPDRNA